MTPCGVYRVRGVRLNVGCYGSIPRFGQEARDRHVVGELGRVFCSKRTCIVKFAYNTIKSIVFLPWVDSDGNRFLVGTVLEWNASVCKHTYCLKWISLRVRELPVGQSVWHNIRVLILVPPTVTIGARDLGFPFLGSGGEATKVVGLDQTIEDQKFRNNPGPAWEHRQFGYGRRWPVRWGRGSVGRCDHVDPIRHGV